MNETSKAGFVAAENHREKGKLGRRGFFAGALGVGALGAGTWGAGALAAATRIVPQLGPANGALTKEERDKMTPAEVLAELKRGNERFRAGKLARQNYLEEQKSSAAGQYPAAVVLGCVDSRAPAEIIFDAGIGDIFNGRVAGNVVNDDLLGSMEFACAVAGAKAVVVFGHTSCGAIKGAIDDVEMGNLTGLLARIKPAITATKFDGEKSSKNAAYVDAVARTNVAVTLDVIRRRSPILEEMEKKGTIVIVGGMYDLKTGAVEFL